ncbi:GNAT family N-acetyltransferase [Acidisphaera sp. L21]|uniref:GNAT family N-acetyltransferase n=1 Tax=Acidisphaera sp. L21 TaxID=1641851 RepID=UPI00131ABAAB|nr:GNAT family N-acetyltransferase [Acidisphaera sp. L21]
MTEERPAYASFAYAQTLAHVGCAIDLPEWRTAMVLRDIPGAPGQVDAMGPYPVCVLGQDADIAAGLDALAKAGAVSVVLVADQTVGLPPADLATHFSLCRAFKTHHVIDRNAGPTGPSKHHRDRIRRGSRHATARLVYLADPGWRAQWQHLYAGLVAKRGITGLQAFPNSCFDALAQLPGQQLLAFAAEASDGTVLAMQLWVRHGDCAYSHLTATSKAGYRVGATYVVYAAAIEHLAECRVLDLGGGAGHADDPNDSLAAFKRGFANATTFTHLYGAVLDPARYAQLSGGHTSEFFPAYRGAMTLREAA